MRGESEGIGEPSFSVLRDYTDIGTILADLASARLKLREGSCAHIGFAMTLCWQQVLLVILLSSGPAAACGWRCDDPPRQPKSHGPIRLSGLSSREASCAHSQPRRPGEYAPGSRRQYNLGSAGTHDDARYPGKSDPAHGPNIVWIGRACVWLLPCWIGEGEAASPQGMTLHRQQWKVVSGSLPNRFGSAGEIAPPPSIADDISAGR